MRTLGAVALTLALGGTAACDDCSGSAEAFDAAYEHCMEEGESSDLSEEEQRELTQECHDRAREAMRMLNESTH